MPSVRPIHDVWSATPWVAATAVDDRTVGDVLRDEVQVAFRGDGPMSSRELVPITPAARELLHGPSRDSAERVLRGMLATLDGQEGAATLRGMSLATDPAAFATHLLLSNTEAGFFPDSVTSADQAGFERSMLRLAPSVRVAKAQNTGWLDLGPRTSAQLRGMLGGGPVHDDEATEVALTLLHELQHSVSPHDPNRIEERHVWLEEGIAETLAWWPGQAAALRERMGVPARAGSSIDPWSVPADSVASVEYRQRHRAVQSLLGLAGISPRRADGTVDPSAHARARQLLQGDVVDRVPRNLARAIVAARRLDPALEPTVRELVEQVDGDPAAVDALAELLSAG